MKTIFCILIAVIIMAFTSDCTMEEPDLLTQPTETPNPITPEPAPTSTITIPPSPVPTCDPELLDFKHYSSIETKGANDWEFFTIDGEHYLAVANTREGNNYNLLSALYRWDGSEFTWFQNIETHGATDWEYFTFNGEHYLVVANHRNNSTCSINSTLYKWNTDYQLFSPIQDIPTQCAYDWEYFTIDEEHYLAVANHYDGDYHVYSKIYKWYGTTFDHHQNILTYGALDWDYFAIDSGHYLVVANYHNGSTRNINSTMYKWDGLFFTAYQNIPTNGAHDWTYFSIAGNHYLVVANYHNNSTRKIDSTIYRLDGSGFTEHQHILTYGAIDWEYFSITGEHYLAVANYSNDENCTIHSKLFKWEGSFLNPIAFQNVLSDGARDWKYFTINDDHYLALANYYANNSFTINSKIFKWSCEDPAKAGVTHSSLSSCKIKAMP